MVVGVFPADSYDDVTPVFMRHYNTVRVAQRITLAYLSAQVTPFALLW